MTENEMIEAVDAAIWENLFGRWRTRSEVAKATIEALRPALLAAEKRGMEKAADYHRAEITRLNNQIEENRAYSRRIGRIGDDNSAIKYCHGNLAVHERALREITNDK